MAEATVPIDADAPGPLGARGVSRRNMMMGGALLLASGIGYIRQPQPTHKPIKDDELEKLIPTHVGEWQFLTSSGLVMPPPDELSETLYDQVFTRIYTAPNKPSVALLIAYSSIQNGLLQLHRPEICYPAGGFKLTDTVLSPLRLPDGREINTRSFAASSPQRSEYVFYWTRLGDYLPNSWLDQRLAVVKANLRGEIPDGVLVRASVFSDANHQAKAALKRFMEELLVSLSPRGLQLLVGQ
ncbi:exosortase-associated protein EpsI, V-type [Sphingobium sp. CR28]|uniref:exosortase-associated protein EpsI, V-type n=1 Tax=Sphingobium sp. CR28 TaxID=3400272 RepID=UPI003FEE48A4